VAFSPDKRTLYVVNNKGKGTGPNINASLDYASRHSIKDLEFGSISRIPLPIPAQDFSRLTSTVVRTNETALRASSPLPPIQHVFFIIRENRTYDEVFGDLPNSSGEPRLARFGMRGWVQEDLTKRDVAVTPNAHALARRFATSDAFFTNGDVSADGHRWAVGIAPTPWMNIAWTTHYGRRRSTSPTSEAPGRRAFTGGADAPMPEDEPEFGSLWEHVAGARLHLMNYGEGLELEGADERQGLDESGELLNLNSPVPQPVFLSTDRKYPTFNMGIPDQCRYAEFLRDFTRRSQAGYKPALTVIRLPNDHTGKPRPEDGYPYETSFVAGNDLALGKIVDTISHSAIWKDTAIFVIEGLAERRGPRRCAPQSRAGDQSLHKARIYLAPPYQLRECPEDDLRATWHRPAQPGGCALDRHERRIYFNARPDPIYLRSFGHPHLRTAARTHRSS
jgi:hypothetical protein